MPLSLPLALSHFSTQLKVTQPQLSTAAALLATLLGVALVLSSSSGAGFVLLLLLLLLLSLALRVVCAVHEAATSPSTSPSSSPSQFVLERFNGNRLDICNSLSDADVAVASLLCLLTQPAHHTHAHTHVRAYLGVAVTCSQLPICASQLLSFDFLPLPLRLCLCFPCNRKGSFIILTKNK